MGRSVLRRLMARPTPAAKGEVEWAFGVVGERRLSSCRDEEERVRLR